MAAWADGLVTVNQPHDRLRAVIDAYRSAGGAGTLALQVHLSWAPTDDEALAIAHDQWAANVFGPPVSWDTATVEAFDALAAQVRREAVRTPVRVSADLAEHRDWLEEYAALGFDDIYLHHVGQTRRSSSTPSESTCCRRLEQGWAHEQDRQHQRPLVEDGGHLLRGRRDLPGLRR